MPHPDLPPIDELLAGHALGDLDEAEQDALRQQLAADPSLQRRLDELNTTLQLLPLALPADSRPPARLRQRLLNPAGRAAHQPDPARPQREPAHRQRLRQAWGPMVMAAFAAGLVVMGLQVQDLRQQLAERPVPGPSAKGLRVSRTMALQDMAPGGTMTGQVVVQADLPYNLLQLKGLPPPPPQHVYRLWAEVDGRQVGCVQFVPDGGGVVSMPIPSEPSSGAQRLSISLEPLLPGGEQPRGPRVLTSV